jgi:hypothetical protein
MHPARILLEAGEAARKQTRRMALQLALAATQGDLSAAAEILGMGYSTASKLLSSAPEVRAWLDETHPGRKGARLDPGGVKRVSPRR